MDNPWCDTWCWKIWSVKADVILMNLPERKIKFSIKDFLSKCDQIRSYIYWRNP